MKLLVTGGAGFVGSALVRTAIGCGYEVVNVDALTYAANLDSVSSVAHSPSYYFEHADICDRSALDRIFEFHQPDAVLHLAAESHVDRSIAEPAKFITTNIVGTYLLLEAAYSYWNKSGRPRGFRFQHVSTDEVFGSLGKTSKFTEETPYAPNSPYSASKASSDHIVRAWHKTYGLPVILSNCCNNYGYYQYPEKLIPKTILNALSNIEIPIYGNGKNVRDWIYVDDHADALIKILENGEIGRSYIVGGFNEYENIYIVELICSILDRLRPTISSYGDLITFVDDRPGHDYRYSVDAKRIQEELNWTPRRTFEQGLELTILWYIENKNLWNKEEDNITKKRQMEISI